MLSNLSRSCILLYWNNNSKFQELKIFRYHYVLSLYDRFESPKLKEIIYYDALSCNTHMNLSSGGGGGGSKTCALCCASHNSLILLKDIIVARPTCLVFLLVPPSTKVSLFFVRDIGGFL